MGGCAGVGGGRNSKTSRSVRGGDIVRLLQFPGTCLTGGGLKRKGRVEGEKERARDEKNQVKGERNMLQGENDRVQAQGETGF